MTDTGRFLYRESQKLQVIKAGMEWPQNKSLKKAFRTQQACYQGLDGQTQPDHHRLPKYGNHCYHSLAVLLHKFSGTLCNIREAG